MIIPFPSCKFRLCLFSEYLLVKYCTQLSHVQVFLPIFCFLHIFTCDFSKENNKISENVSQCHAVHHSSFDEGKAKAFAREMKLFQNKEHEYVSM